MTDTDALIARMRQPGPTDDDGIDHEPDPHAWWDEERALARMEDAYEREMDARWER